MRLTDEQRQTLGALLRQRMDEAEAALRASTSESQPVDVDPAVGPLSRADAMQQKEMAAARRTRVEITVKQLGSAMARLRNGEFGDCLRCGEEIPFDRLQEKPETTLCADCQKTRDR